MPAPKLRLPAVTALALLLIVFWDASGLDLPLALAMGGPAGFPLRDHWLLTTLLHSGAKWLAWLLMLALCIGVTAPFGPLRRLPLSRRVQLVATTLLASGFVALMKASSHVSCPWDLAQFGGVARYMSHWAGWTSFDGGGGRCFPAGHATTGFAFLGGWFALRKDLPRLARWWLAAALAAGLVLGLSQQLRGAHFMSHTLWSGWICWVLVWLADPLFARRDAAAGLDLAAAHPAPP
jgi:membrane-associated PAP2 superfamily phosphatase